jgi:hypothetical protein
MVSYDPAILEDTLAALHAGGAHQCETVVLWLGRRSTSPETVTEVFRPAQVVDRDYFRIPAPAMRDLLRHLRAKELHLLAQVHSHPEEAFHSYADDRWAIVRHIGALSLVVPWFGLQTRADTFLTDVAAFQLDAADQWLPVEPHAVLRKVPHAG